MNDFFWGLDDEPLPEAEPVLAGQVLRDYQNRAVDSALREFESVQSTLLVLATGTGKTSVACEIAKRMQPKKTLFLAHREELIYQAAQRMNQFGLKTGIEMAETRSLGSYDWDCLVSTIQTQIAGHNGERRMSKFDPMDFGLVVVDEGHRIVGASYGKVLEYYKRNPEVKILVLTATPDRADGVALRGAVNSVAYDYEILSGIEDGWLVPVRPFLVGVEGLDFSHVRTTAGDLNGADLADVMEKEKPCHKIIQATFETMYGLEQNTLSNVPVEEWAPYLEDCGRPLKTLVFATTVKHAEMMSNIFNRTKDMAAWICGTTPKLDRRSILKRFGSGELKILCNVGCLTEGWDEPGVELIVMARPTKSRCLFSQMIGRGTRPLPGVADPWETAEERRRAIADSPKAFLSVLDFAGNSGRHKLMSSADILGGKYPAEVVELAKKRMKNAKRPGLLGEEMEKARQEIEKRKRETEARKARLVGKASYAKHEVDPFDQYDRASIGAVDRPKYRNEPTLTEKQYGVLVSTIGIAEVKKLNGWQQRSKLNDIFRQRQAGCAPASFKQKAVLARFGYDTEVGFKEASEMIDALARNGWKKPC